MEKDRGKEGDLGSKTADVQSKSLIPDKWTLIPDAYMFLSPDSRNFEASPNPKNPYDQVYSIIYPVDSTVSH